MQRINISWNTEDMRGILGYIKGSGHSIVCRILFFSFLTVVFIYYLIIAFRALNRLCANKSMWRF